MRKRSFLHRASAGLAALALLTLCACGGVPAQNTAGPAGGAADGVQEPAAPAEHAEALSVKSSKAEENGRYIALINDELDKLRELGLFYLEFEIDSGVKPYNVADSVKNVQKFQQSDGPCRSYSVNFDKDSGQITYLYIVANAQEDWETVTSESGLEIYDRLDAIIDTEMTLGDYCDAWAQYRGYERWELPEGVDADTLFLDAPELEQWAEGIYDEVIDRCTPGLTISFYRAGEDEPVPGYIQYHGTTGGPELSFGESFGRG